MTGLCLRPLVADQNLLASLLRERSTPPPDLPAAPERSATFLGDFCRAGVNPFLHSWS